MRAFPERRSRSQAGFKIAELMVAVGIFVLGGGVAYPLLVGDVSLYVRNFSLNKSNNSLRQSLQQLKQDINMAIEPPHLVNGSVTGNTGYLQAVPDSTVSASGILLWVSLGPAYEMVGAGPNGTGAVPVTSTITLNRRLYDPTLTPHDVPSSPMPQVNDRLVIMSPKPYDTGMPETITLNGGGTLQKPGRRITAVNGTTTNPVADNNSASLTINLDTTNPLPAITGPQTVYIVREVAYIVYTINDANSNPVESRLVRYASVADSMTNGNVLIRDVDPAPLETDPTTKKTIMPFNFYGGRSSLSPLWINLPVRAVDYANAITARQSGPSSEFNVYLRSSPQMGIKTRVD